MLIFAVFAALVFPRISLGEDSNDYSKMTGKHKIVWSGEKMFFDFYLDSEKEYKLFRSPHATFGEPWPLPQEYSANYSKVFRIDPENLNIINPFKRCDIILHSIKRFRHVTTKTAGEETGDNLDSVENAYIYPHQLKNPQEIYSAAKDVTGLEIQAQTCSKAPFPNMNESYSINIKGDKLVLTAEESWGVMRGLETIMQLTHRKNQEFYIRDVVVKDFPRFQHRGILVDSARHFMKKETILEIIDGLQMNKMNVLHWHLVDKQSFPFVSKTYPQLAAKGAYHSTLTYTHDDVKEIIEYARLRGVRILPEFDMPGHAFAWGHGHPEILTQCYSKGKPVPGHLGAMDPSKNQTYQFLKNFLSEVISLFPEPYIHLGSDEVHLGCWESNPGVQNFARSLKKMGVTHTASTAKLVWSYFLERIMRIIQELAKEKRKDVGVIVWDDGYRMKVKIPKEAAIQVWMMNENQQQILMDEGYKMVFSDTCWYLDSRKRGAWFSFYECDPNPHLNDRDKFILGGEGCLWSEFITNENALSVMWPTSSAIAERLWSKKTVRDIRKAASRLQEQRCRMLKNGLLVGAGSGPEFCVFKQSPLHKIWNKNEMHAENTKGNTDSSEMQSFQLYSFKYIDVIKYAILLSKICFIVIAVVLCGKCRLKSLNLIYRKTVLKG